MPKKESKKLDFGNRIIPDDVLKEMTYMDMISAIYHCQKVISMTKEDCESVSNQLLRILLRIVISKELDLNKIWYQVEVGELDYFLTNDMITSEEWDERHNELVKIYKPKETIDDMTGYNEMAYREYRDEVNKESCKNIRKKLTNKDEDKFYA
jgi:flagellar biosynthesis regulator FlaF